jgi:hypothetical protein
MAWLKLTLTDGRTTIFNSDKVSEICDLRDSNGAAVWSHGTVTEVHESVEDIGEMIECGEIRKRIERIFLAIVCNFPHGYDPDEIWDAANTLDSAGPCRDVIIDG